MSQLFSLSAWTSGLSEHLPRGRRFGACFAMVMALVATPAIAPRAFCSEVPEGVAADVPADWWGAVQRDIVQSEYHMTHGRDPASADPAAGYQAPNRAQNFRACFDGVGIRLIPRTTPRDEAPAWEWRLTLAGWGRRGSLVEPAGAAQMIANGNRIEYRRGDLTEWYVNDARGLEQGFTIDVRPGSSAAQEPLRVELAVGGSLSAALDEDGQAVDFMTPAGARAIRFDHLLVVDASRRELPAHFECHTDAEGGERVTITVDDADAVYPIIIDPLATSPSWTAESNQADAYMGHSVATAGDVNGDGFSDVIVGIYNYDNGQLNEGLVHVYHGSAVGLSLTADWINESNQASARYGYSVASAGDVNGDGFSDVIVGAYSYDNGQTDEGRAYVYHGSAGGLNLGPDWIAESNQASASFGWSVASAGDVNGDGFSDVIVGAPDFDTGLTDVGRVSVFHGSASGLGAAATWSVDANTANARAGWSVASAGDVNGDGFDDVVVGIPFFTNLLTAQGEAVVYHGSASGLGGFNWVVTGAQASMFYGISVASAGDVNGDGYGDVIVGAYLFDNGQAEEGRVFVYHGSASGLPLSGSNWNVESDQVNAQFGVSVATAGDVNGDGYSDVIVGAYQFDNGQTNEGRAFVYLGSSGGLELTPNWTAEGDQVGASYGFSVAPAGDVNGDGYSDVIVGARFLDNGEINEGRVMVYHGAAKGLGTNPNWSGESNQAGAEYGTSVSTAGDVNGDGFSDVIVGAPFYDNGQADEGRAFVYHGSAGGLSLTPSWTAESDQADAWFGHSVASAGDVDGDGFGDVIVGVPRYDAPQTNEGRAYVYRGSTGGLNLTASWTAESNWLASQFGISVSAGDVNGDGFSDVVVGAPYFSDNTPGIGRVFVYHGSTSGLSPASNWTGDSPQSGAEFGSSVSTAGDVNGDGFTDVIVGAAWFDNGQTDEGRAFAYHGSAAGLSPVVNWTAESDQDLAWFGSSVATAGDVNGDGFSDVIVGAPQFDSGQSNEGRAFVYHGSAAGLSLTAGWTAESDQGFAGFGASVSSAGDVNGDGFSDVVVGSVFFGNGQSNEGRAYVYHGSAAGLNFTPDWTAESNQVNAFFGRPVAAAGDVNGDGFSDVIVGADSFDNGQTDEGRVFVYYGNGGGGFPFLPRQVRADDSAPISLLGTSDSETGFQLKADGYTAAGQAELRLQYEVKPAGVPFDGTGLVTSSAVSHSAPDGASPISAPANSTPLSVLVSGLTPGTLYHWRLRVVSDSPFFPHSRWLSMPGNAPSEADVRTAAMVSAVDGGIGAPPSPVRLEAGAPNPFQFSTSLSFTLPERGNHRLAVYDVTGREVAVLSSGLGEAGSHRLRWDGRDGRGGALPSGMYFLRLEYGGRAESRKLVITR